MIDTREEIESYLSNLPAESEKKPKSSLVAYQTLLKGESLAAVCVELGIHDLKLNMWRNHYPEFENAVRLGLMAGQRYWEQWAIDKAENGQEYNIQWYNQMMANRYGVTKDRKIRVAGLKASAKGTKNAQIIADYVQGQEFTSRESRDMMGFVKDMADIKIQSDLERRLEEAEKRIEAMNRAL